MAQKVIPLFSERGRGSEQNLAVAKAIADKARLKMNEVFIPQPVIRTTSRTS